MTKTYVYSIHCLSLKTADVEMLIYIVGLLHMQLLLSYYYSIIYSLQIDRTYAIQIITYDIYHQIK